MFSRHSGVVAALFSCAFFIPLLSLAAPEIMS